MTTIITHKIDPDRTVSWNIDKMVWEMFEKVYPRRVPMEFYSNHAVLWLYHQYVIWYDSLETGHPVGQLTRSNDYR